MDNLECKIELIRRELLKTAEERGLSSKETVNLSVELDHLLNDYSYDEKSMNGKHSIHERRTPENNKKFG